MTNRTFKVYGAEGHRMKFSFCPSITYDFRSDYSDDSRVISVSCSDVTGTNDYVIVSIDMETKFNSDEILHELFAQIDDGIFENCRIGKVIELFDGYEQTIEDLFC